jgi:hypothetical protein
LRKLQLSEWASFAEIISALAVIISLLYVGYQINENTSEVRAANRQQLVNRAHSATMGFATSPELAAVMAKVAAGAELTPPERSQYAYTVRAVLYDVQEAFLLHREGRLDAEYWKTRTALVLAYLAQTPAHDVYLQDKSRGVLHADFVEWLDRAKEGDPAPVL